MSRLVRITVWLAILLMGFASARAEGVTPFVDLLYWHASEETSANWASVISPDPAISPFSPTSTFKATDTEFGWNTGLRTGFGVEPADWFTDLKVYWTYFPTSKSDTIAAGNQIILPEFFSGFMSGDQFSFNAASVDWSFAFNTVDLEAGHAFALTDFISLRPTVGLKIAVIDQSINANWSNSTNGLTATERVQHDYWGLGPSFGLDGRWDVPRFQQLSMVSSFSGAFMAGSWNVVDTYQRTNPATTTANTYQTFTTSLRDSSLGTLTLRYFLGFEWTRPGEIPVHAHLGYELQWWANQQRLTTFQQLPMHGDLTLQGGSCGLSVSF